MIKRTVVSLIQNDHTSTQYFQHHLIKSTVIFLIQNDHTVLLTPYDKKNCTVQLKATYKESTKEGEKVDDEEELWGNEYEGLDLGIDFKMEKFVKLTW